MLDYLLLYLLCLWNSMCNIFLWHFRAFFSSFRMGLKFDLDDLVGLIEENTLIRPFIHCRSDFTVVVSGVHRFNSRFTLGLFCSKGRHLELSSDSLISIAGWGHVQGPHKKPEELPCPQNVQKILSCL